jgi:CDP-glucose 4,6-dehydratase
VENLDVDRFWLQRRVFVTGATGLLGSWLTQELVARGADVVCLVRDWVPQSRFLTEAVDQRATIVRGELEDFDVVLRTINEYEIDTVFHLGAQTIVGTAARSTLSTFEANIRGTWNVLEASHQCSRLVNRVIIASSDKAYGEHEDLPYTEDTPLQGRFPYDASKSCADLLSLSYFHTYGLPVLVTRCGNLYGGGDLNFNRLIPGTIRSALQGERPIIRSDGTFIRDYFYVRDAVAAYLRAAEQLEKLHLGGEAFNFGNETPVSVVEVVDELLTLIGRTDLSPIIQDEASNEIPRQYLDCAKARSRLDWTPNYDLSSGLADTVPWYAEWLNDLASQREPGV